MTTSIPREEATAAVVAALEPQPWRTFTPERLARRVVAVSDREDLRDLLASVPGADVGSWEGPPQPADRNDPRVTNLVEFLAAFPWSQLGLTLLCRHMVAVLHHAD